MTNLGTIDQAIQLLDEFPEHVYQGKSKGIIKKRGKPRKKSPGRRKVHTVEYHLNEIKKHKSNGRLHIKFCKDLLR